MLFRIELRSLYEYEYVHCDICTLTGRLFLPGVELVALIGQMPLEPASVRCPENTSHKIKQSTASLRNQHECF